MLRSMTASQFMEWMQFAELEPFGEDRADRRTGMVTQILANVYRDKSHRAAPYTLEECVPHPVGDSFPNVHTTGGQRQSWQHMKGIALIMSGASWEDN